MKAQLTLLISTLLFLIINSSANTYYISNDGSTSNDGLSELNPFLTIEQASLVYQAGDTILFKRGDIFREESDSTFTDIYIASYGNINEADPIISGGVEITGWTLWQNNIYMVDYSQPVHNLFVDNKIQLYARYPNSGWIRPKGTSGSNIILTDDLSSHPDNADDYWNGARLRWRRWSWWFETPTITDYSSNGAITISSGFGGNSVPGWSFYIDNKLEELDSVGEWFQDGSNRIYVKLPDGKSPGDYTIEGGVLSKGFRVRSSVVKNLCFSKQSSSGLAITGSSLIDSCTFENIGNNSGGNAISASWSVQNTTIENCIFKNNLNLAISWNEDPNHGGSNYIKNNQFTNIGMIPAYGGTGPYHAAGIIVYNGRNIHVEKNYFENIGYAGVIFSSKGNYCEYNIIKHCMATLNDGGAIYTNCDSTVIRYNLIYDTEGDLESSAPWANLGHGIWPEFLSDFKETTIEHNTVIGSGGFGIFLPNNYDCIINNNTLFNNNRAQMGISGTTYPDQNHLIEDNIFFCLTPFQAALNYEIDFDYGVFNNNYYGNLYNWFPIESNQNYNPSHFSSLNTWADTQFKTNIEMLPEYRSWNHGNELVLDTSFTDGVSNWIIDDLSSSGEISHNTNNKLDGNCLETNYNGPLTILKYNNDFSLGIDQFYELSFSFQFNTTGPLTNSSERVFQVFVNNSETDEIIFNQSFPVLTDRKNARIVFQSNATANGSIKFFFTTNTQNTFWVDNVSLKPVYAHERNYKDEAIIICNDSMAVRKFLPNEGSWKMIDGTVISDSITLQAFKSIILIRNETGQLNNTPPINDAPYPNSLSEYYKNNIEISFFPNPFKSSICILSPNTMTLIEIISLDSKKLVYSKNVNDKTVTISPNGILTGIYILRITNQDGTLSNSKLIKI